MFLLIRSNHSENSLIQRKSLLSSIHQCQLCGREHGENAMICSSCQENQLIGREMQINQTSPEQQVDSLETSSSSFSYSLVHRYSSISFRT